MKTLELRDSPVATDDPWADDPWADELFLHPKDDPLAAPATDDYIVIDIETGPRPWEEIEQFFEPPEKPAEFDPASVKIGRLTPPKAAEKIEEARAKHQVLLDAWPAAVEKAKADFLSKAALSPITGEVLAVGYHWAAAGFVVDGGDEPNMLAQFWRNFWWARDHKARIVGFNIFGFDLPFLVKRSWLLGVGVPDDLLQNGRYWHRVFVDLMQVWGCAAYGERIKLDLVAAYFGCARKSGSGADFAGLWHDPATREKAVEYLKQDLRVTLEVAEKMGVV